MKGPTFCGKGNCTSTCDEKSECDPGWGSQWSTAEKCPLNVCCSEYGFCGECGDVGILECNGLIDIGTTADFCQGNVPTSPSCSGTSSDARTIGYYEGWNLERSCQSKALIDRTRSVILTIISSHDSRKNTLGILYAY
jgi:chitinase